MSSFDVPPPELTGIRPLEELSGRNNGNRDPADAWDEIDECSSFSAFLRDTKSVRSVVNRNKETSGNSELAQKAANETNDESSTDNGNNGNRDPDALDENDECASFSAFLRDTNSVRSVVNRKKETSGNSELAQKAADETTNESSTDTGDFTGVPIVKNLFLHKALTLPETTTIHEACCQMAAEDAHVLVLTDSNAVVSGILRSRDIVTKAIARELDLVNTAVSTVMTKNPISVSSDTLVLDAMVKMNKESVNQLLVLENGEVTGFVKQLQYLTQLSMGLTIAEGEYYADAFADALEKRWELLAELEKEMTAEAEKVAE